MSRGKAEEFKIQAKCAMWLWNTYPETRGNFILIDNNSDNAIQALQKRAMGQIKGAADTLFFWKKKLYFIEFKTQTGRQSDYQIKFEFIANEHAEMYIIIRSIEQFIEVIESILRPI